MGGIWAGPCSFRRSPANLEDTLFARLDLVRRERSTSRRDRLQFGGRLSAPGENDAVTGLCSPDEFIQPGTCGLR
jgi:hypothetical protein